MRAGELGPFWAIIRAIALCAVLAGCIVGIPSLGEPSRMLTVTDEIPPVGTVENRLFEQYLATVNSSPTAAKTYRNEYITARMSAIDMAYTNYEIALTDESGGTDFGATVASLGLTTTAALIPVAQTSRLLSGIATGVTGVDGAFNQKVLITKTIQNVQTQMRKDRHDQAAIIFNNMKCKVDVYPLGMALSDLELYHRAGTFSSGLIGIANTVNKAEATSKPVKDIAQPGGTPNATDPPAAPAQLTPPPSKVPKLDKP